MGVRACPFCAEFIQDTADVCSFCNLNVTPLKRDFTALYILLGFLGLFVVLFVPAGIMQQRERTQTERTQDYFTVGATKETVLRIQGTPTEVVHRSDGDTWIYVEAGYPDGETWVYKESNVYFREGRVFDWLNLGNIKVPETQ